MATVGVESPRPVPCAGDWTGDLSTSILGLDPTARLFGADRITHNRFVARRLGEGTPPLAQPS